MRHDKSTSPLMVCLLIAFLCCLPHCANAKQGIEVEESDVESPLNKSNIVPDNPNNGCSLIASPTSVEAGQPTTLTIYTHPDVIGASVNGLDIDAATLPQGQITLTPAATMEYDGVVVFANGDRERCQTIVTVTNPTPTNPPPTNPPPGTNPGTNPTGQTFRLTITGGAFSGGQMQDNLGKISCNFSSQNQCSADYPAGTSLTLTMPQTLFAIQQNRKFRYAGKWICNNQDFFRSQPVHSLTMDRNWSCTTWYE